MNFLVVKIYGGFWENTSPSMYSYASIGLLSVSEGLKLLKITKYTTIGHFKSISTPPNLDLNTFPSITNIWRLLREYESLK